MIGRCALLTSIAALLLATGTAHAIEYQGKLPKPVQRLPHYPPVVCVAPNWATEPCEDRQPRYWALLIADVVKALQGIAQIWYDWSRTPQTNWFGAVKYNFPLSWDGRWPNRDGKYEEPEAEDDEDEGGFPKEIQGLWCLSPSESTKTKIILNPHADGCKSDEGVVLISYSQFYGPNGQNDCALDTKTKIASEKEIWEPEHIRSSAVYHIQLKCLSKPNRMNFTIHHNAWDNGDEELVVRPSTQG
jgi:hypothetical protein